MKRLTLFIILFIFNAEIFADSAPRYIDLHETVKLAAENNIILKTLNLKTEKELLSVKQSQKSRLPELSFYSEALIYDDDRLVNFMNKPGGIMDFENRYLTYNFNLNIPLYTGGLLNSKIKQSKINKNISAINFLIKKNEIIFHTISVYLKILELEKLKLTTEKHIESMKNNRFNIVELIINGKAIELDAMKIDVRLNTLLNNLKVIEKNIMVNRQILNRLTNTDKFTDSQLQYSDKTISINNNVSANLLLNNFELKMFELQLQILKEKFKIINADIRPKISAVMSAGGRNDLNGDNYSNNFAGVKLSIPIFDKSNSNYEKLKNDADYKIMEYLYNDNIVQLNIRFQNNILDKEVLENKIRLFAESVKTAEKTLELENESYINGRSAVNNIIDAEYNLFNAKYELLKAEYEYKLNQFELLDLTGNELNTIFGGIK